MHAARSPGFGNDMSGTSRSCLSAWVIAVMAAATLVSQASAADYPNRSIHVVVPFAAAGVTDIVARILFDRIAQSVGQTIIIDDRPGAGGNIGLDQVAKSAPDGYTLVVADPSTSLPANVTLFPKLNFHPVRDLAPVALFGTTGAVLIVSNALPARSIEEFVALAKRKPGDLMYGSTGNGTPGHLNGVLFSQLVGIKTVHVPYRTGSQGTTDLLTGRIQFWIAPIPTRLEQINSGQLRALAVAGNERSADLPGLPTIRESGFGDFDASTTYAVFAPKGTPSDIIGTLYAEIARALGEEVVAQKFRAAGVEPRTGSPSDVARLLDAQIAQWADVIRSAGIKIDER
jgi:tripartite-type tricarboxylate transporter receptor subunit TctC